VTSVTIQPQVTLRNSNILTNAITNIGNRSAVSSNGVSEACRDIYCDLDATCELRPGNLPRCSCRFDCASTVGKGGGKAVCASGMRLYPSVCVMKVEGCHRQEELRRQPLDLCRSLEWAVACLFVFIPAKSVALIVCSYNIHCGVL
jgi:coxsackievirus/adenovirus receptor